MINGSMRMKMKSRSGEKDQFWNYGSLVVRTADFSIRSNCRLRNNCFLKCQHGEATIGSMLQKETHQIDSAQPQGQFKLFQREVGKEKTKAQCPPTSLIGMKGLIHVSCLSLRAPQIIEYNRTNTCLDFHHFPNLVLIVVHWHP